MKDIATPSKMPGTGSMKRRHLSVRLRGPVLSVCVVVSACSPDSNVYDDSGLTVGLRDVATVSLEESGSAYIGDIWRPSSLAVSQEGWIAVADRMTSRVLVFRPDGSLHTVVGREGDGPGEFRRPESVTWGPSSRLWVSDNLTRRITVLTEDFEIDNIFSIDSADYVTSIQHANDQVVVAVNYVALGRESFEANVLNTYAVDGSGPLESFMMIDPRVVLAYLGDEYEPVFRVVNNFVVAGSNLGYPLRIFNLDGQETGIFGSAPPSVGSIRHPEPGEFMADPIAGSAWLRSFGKISSLHVVEDSVLVVTHERLDPEVMNQRVYLIFADFYDLNSLQKIAEDIPLPGRIVHSDGDRIWTITAQPPEPWTITASKIYIDNNIVN